MEGECTSGNNSIGKRLLSYLCKIRYGGCSSAITNHVRTYICTACFTWSNSRPYLCRTCIHHASGSEEGGAVVYTYTIEPRGSCRAFDFVSVCNMYLYPYIQLQCRFYVSSSCSVGIICSHLILSHFVQFFSLRLPRSSP